MSDDEFPALLDRLLDRHVMGEAESESLMDRILDGALGPERLAAFVTALRAKGVAVDELVGFARSMRHHAAPLPHTIAGPVLDTCGTGGATHKSFNVSTAAAFVVAAAGVRVAKHGNRSVTRPSGSADVLEAAGARLDLGPASVARVLDEVGVAFLFAPGFHPAMKHAAPVRRALGIRTVFNLLGPLTNPASATHQVLGVHDAALLEPMAQALARLGCQGGFTLHGEPGFDEATPCGIVHYVPIVAGRAAARRSLDVGEFGIARCATASIAPVPKSEAAALLADLISGRGTAARQDTVALNAAFGLVAVGKTPDLAAGLGLARKIVSSGMAKAKWEAFLAATRSVP